MFILNIKRTVLSSVFNWDKAKQFMGSSMGQDLIGGVLAKPVFSDVRKTTEARLKNGGTNINKDINPFIKAFQWVKDSFSYGDLFAGCGLGFMLFNHKFLGSTESGFFGRSLNWVAGIVSGASFALGRIGQALGLHREFVYGPEICKILVQEYENESGKKCFLKLDNDQLVQHAEKQENTLAYNQDASHEITERHTLGQLGGFFSGTFGTGKSEGVRLILGNFVKKMKAENKEVEIFKLDLSNFDEALKRYDRIQKKGKEALNLIQDDLGEGNIGGNKTLIAFQYLIGRCKETVQASKESGKASAIFIDEWDKIFDPRKLHGCDPEEISRLFNELNYLLEDNYGNILITSNKTCEQLEEELRNIIPENVLGAFVRRLKEVIIELPDSNTQARIISNYVDASVKGSELSYDKDFSFTVGEESVQVSNKKQLTALLMDHSSKNGNYLANGVLTPNDLRIIIEGLPGYLRSQRKIGQDEEIKITLDDIRNQVEALVNEKVDKNKRMLLRQTAYSTIQHYIQTNKQALAQTNSDQKGNSGLSLFKSIYHSKNGIFYSKDDNHAIQFLGNGKVSVMIKNDKTKEIEWDYDKVEIDGKEFEQMVTTELVNVLPKEKGPEEFLKMLITALASGNMRV